MLNELILIFVADCLFRAKYLGITEPISLNEPQAQDLKLTSELEKDLRDFNLFESAEESRKREEVLGKLNVIVKEWVRQVSVQKVPSSSYITYSIFIYNLIHNATLTIMLTLHRDYQNKLLLKLEQRFLHLDLTDLECTFLELILIHFVLAHVT